MLKDTNKGVKSAGKQGKKRQTRKSARGKSSANPFGNVLTPNKENNFL